MNNSRIMNYELKIFQIIFIIIIIVILIGTGVFILSLKEESISKESLEGFAKCLADKGAIMYGNYNCVHCQNEKNAFGESFKFIKYVECTENPKICIDAGIEVVPSWIFSDGKKLTGRQGIEKLSKESGCLLIK